MHTQEDMVCIDQASQVQWRGWSIHQDTGSQCHPLCQWGSNAEEDRWWAAQFVLDSSIPVDRPGIHRIHLEAHKFLLDMELHLWSLPDNKTQEYTISLLLLLHSLVHLLMDELLLLLLCRNVLSRISFQGNCSFQAGRSIFLHRILCSFLARLELCIRLMDMEEELSFLLGSNIPLDILQAHLIRSYISKTKSIIAFFTVEEVARGDAIGQT